MSDYGARPNRPLRRMTIRLVIIFALLVAGGVAFLLWSNVNSRARTLANASTSIAARALIGTPCKAGTAQGELGRGDAWKTNIFNDVEYGRRVGDVECAVTKDKSPSGFKSVCQFDAPAELRVVDKSGARYFEIGLGVPATLVMADSGLTCVIPSQGG
jgi:hypothetical protein